MSKKEQVKYTDEPILLGEEVEDFLPRPEELVFKNPARKVTITLDEKSITFFKAEAERLHVPYQRMIRNLLSEYVERQRAQNTPDR
jgi:predicted DNA binding CopG/RHH family protein